MTQPEIEITKDLGLEETLRPAGRTPIMAISPPQKLILNPNTSQHTDLSTRKRRILEV
jgi:hypothetical protein